MVVKEKVEFLNNATAFKDWQKKNPNSYLAHIFRMLDKENENIWQFGFYNKDDTITTFLLDGEKVNIMPEPDKIFKKDTAKIPALDLDKIKIDFDDAIAIANKKQKEKYLQHQVLKMFAILQVIQDKQVYNITYVTQTFFTLNLRVDSTNSEIVHEKLTSLMDMMEIEKGKGKKSDTSYIG